MRNTTDRLGFALAMMAAATVFGTVGDRLLSLSLLGAIYQGAGETLRVVNLHDESGPLVLALRPPGDNFIINPTGDYRPEPGHVIVAVGTDQDLLRLENLAKGSS